jgi:hypothetical protein
MAEHAVHRAAAVLRHPPERQVPDAHRVCLRILQRPMVGAPLDQYGRGKGAERDGQVTKQDRDSAAVTTAAAREALLGPGSYTYHLLGRHPEALVCAEVLCLSELCQMDHVGMDIVPSDSQPNVPENPDQWVRFLLPLFVHAGVIHVLLAMAAQFYLGAQIERQVWTEADSDPTAIY